MAGPIASAVVLPDELQVPTSPVNNQKRRQESITEDSAKRPRFSEDSAANHGHNSFKDINPAPVRREKGRERRLFGAALGALSQNSATAAQRRRSEIEKRQLAQRHKDDQESEKRKAERTARRKEQRWKEQKRFEKALMRTRHENLVNMAHFLQTEAEPRLYYKPWEITPDEQDRIRDQIAEAEEIVKREIEEYEARQRHEDQRRRDTSEEGGRDAVGSQTGKNHNADAPQDTSTTNGETNGSAKSPKDLDMKDDRLDNSGTESLRNGGVAEDTRENDSSSHEPVTDETSKADDDDENGEDIVEEAAEDTVIY